jgi:NTE family protein
MYDNGVCNMALDENTIDLLAFHRSTQGLDQQQIRQIASCAEVISYRAGHRVHASGSMAESLLLIMSGELEMSVSLADGSDQPIQYIGRDDQFGFLAIHDTEPIPVTVNATQDTVVICVAKPDAVRLLQEVPLWRRSLMRSIGPRLRQAFIEQKQKKRPRVVAVIHAQDDSRDVTLALAGRLTDLQEKVAIVSDDARVLRRAPGPSGPLLDERGSVRPHDELRATAIRWSNADRLILDASIDRQSSELAAILSAADAIYCVCATESSGRLIEKLKTVLAEIPCCQDKLYVVRVLGSYEQVAKRVPGFEGLCRSDFKLHSNDLIDSPVCTRRAGLERIIHHLRGVSIGLALGGGAARGMAHLGVLKVLEEEGITLDRMSGTSAGALTGIGYAAGLSADFLTAAFAKDLKPSWHYRLLPYGDAWYMLGKYRRGGWEGMLRKHYHHWCLEELPIPFTAVSADLISASEVRRTSGDATGALLESINLPVMSRPICRDGMAIVDGGVLNVVPANVLVEQEANVVVAVDVSAKISFECRGNRPDTPTEKMKIPSAAQTAARVRTVQDRNIRSLGTGSADLVIEPDVSNVELTDFQHAPEIAALGRSAAEQALPRLRQILHQVDPQLFPIHMDDCIRIAN